MNNNKKNIPQVEGVVEEALPSLTFRVRSNDGREILAHLAGKLKLHHIKIIPGDKVIVEMGPDGRRGRIIRRL
jgi:translation initiation factor IF-1